MLLNLLSTANYSYPQAYPQSYPLCVGLIYKRLTDLSTVSTAPTINTI
jgi:hypothetical protein